jgi:Tol biopolymer transport system component
MKLLNSNRMRLILIGILAVIVGSGGSAKADFTFGQRVNLGPIVNSSYADFDPFISPDGLSLYFCSPRPGGLGQEDIWVTMRATISDPWGPPVNPGAPVNSEYREGCPSITADGLILVFNANTPGGLGGSDIWLTTRPTNESPWGPPMNLGSPVKSASDEFCGCISPDGCSLYFFSMLTTTPAASFGGDIYMTTRSTTDSPWDPPVKLGLMPSRNGSGNFGPSISADGLALFFDSDYANVKLYPDIWLATRTSNDSTWGTPILLGPEINTLDGEQKPSISSDGSTLYWCSGLANLNTWDLWQSTITPIVDLNSDGIVDAEDMCIMVDHWGTDEQLCDIGPMPWGDGVVDVQDLVVLAEHLFEDNRLLVARWPLDEIEGMSAHDNVSGNNDFVMGDPIWQPTGGKVDGALELDGVDDCIITSSSLNPADGPFSVFAWIKGGAPGQVVLSQMGIANWLCADESEGYLMTELAGPGGGPLQSQTVITDDEWHQIGFEWNGSHRTLYVDDVLVAEDTQDSLNGSTNSLYIGTGKGMELGTFWSELIDDVRIYTTP